MDEQGSGFPSWLLLLAPLAIVGVLWMMKRSKSETRIDKAMKPISRAIDQSELPDSAKSMLLTAVDQVRGAMNTIGATASEMAER